MDADESGYFGDASSNTSLQFSRSQSGQHSGEFTIGEPVRTPLRRQTATVSESAGPLPCGQANLAGQLSDGQLVIPLGELRVDLLFGVRGGGGVRRERLRLGLAIRAEAAVADLDLAAGGGDLPKLGGTAADELKASSGHR